MKMKSMILTFRFRNEIQRLKDEDGWDFTHTVHMPEIVDPKTGRVKHARGDHNHLLKRIASDTSVPRQTRKLLLIQHGYVKDQVRFEKE